MKKILSVAMILCLMVIMLSVAIGATFENAGSSSNMRITASEKAVVIEVLNFVDKTKEGTEYEDVDFESVRVGEKITKYIATNDGLREAYYGYPIIYQGKVIAFATALGNDKFQISSAEADYINESGFENVSIIYDSDGCYVTNGVDLKLMAENYDDTPTDRISIANCLDTAEQATVLQSIITSKIDGGELLGYVPEDDGEAVYSISGAIDNYYSCTVDYLTQNPYDKLCWAACVGMVANYFDSSLNLTAYSVATTYFDSTDVSVFNDGVSRTEIASLLRNTYDCEYYQSLDYTPSDDNIKRNISGGYPLVALFYVTDTGKGHTTVADAIHTTSKYIRVCDPGCGRIYVYRDYEHEDQSSYQEYAYTSPNTGNWLYMKEQVARFS